MNAMPLLDLIDRPFIADICERKSKGHRNSKRANLVARKSAPSMRKRLLALLEERGVAGITGKEFARIVDKPFNAVSGRLSNAKTDGLIVEVADVEDGAVVVLAELEAAAREYWAKKGAL